MVLQEQKLIRNMYWVLLFLLISRLLAMYYIPLNDSTEARYGEIARIMLETKNWITPMHQYGVPFWAKPPLSIWLSALSMKSFGVSPFSARLPGLLLSIGVLSLVWGVARKRSGIQTAVIATLVLASSLYFYLDAGTVMTDPSLLFCTTLMMLAFWRGMVHCERAWGYIFFVAMGLGLLAKGPVALILMGMPIFLWVLMKNKWSHLFQRLPWISGLSILSLIALPWYYLAEKSTPGFLYYFIIGEHISRFLQAGWNGDKYGFAHVAPYGMIWIYALLGTCPWCIPAIVWLGHHRKHLLSLSRDEDGWILYCLLCALTPLVFFTFARNIIYPYVFPSLPAFALLFAEFVKRSKVSEQHINRYFPMATFSGFAFLIGAILFVGWPEKFAKSHYRVANLFAEQHPSAESRLIYWADKTDYSAQFYSAGHAYATVNEKTLCRLLSNDVKNYVMVDSEEQRAVPEYLMTQLNYVAQIQVLSKQYTMYVSDHPRC